jgi:hypothetical protein
VKKAKLGKTGKALLAKTASLQVAQPQLAAKLSAL